MADMRKLRPVKDVAAQSRPAAPVVDEDRAAPQISVLFMLVACTMGTALKAAGKIQACSALRNRLPLATLVSSAHCGEVQICVPSAKRKRCADHTMTA